jgi:hypothetical protein
MTVFRGSLGLTVVLDRFKMVLVEGAIYG